MLGRNLKIDELAEWIDARVDGQVNKELELNRIVTDSRYKGIDGQSVFFALKTISNDGHQYIFDAFNMGARVFVVSEDVSGDFDAAVFLHVEDTLKALQHLASLYRDNFNYPLLAITGSNGKTVVKEWIYQLSSSAFDVVRSPKSYNSQIGVPLTLMGFPIDADLGIVETGISKPGEMEAHLGMIKPEWGLLTNIHQAHMENFESRKQLIREKLKLFEKVKKLIFRSDDEEITSKIEANLNSQHTELVSWSISNTGDYNVRIKKEGEHTKVSLNGKAELEFEIPFRHEASIEDAVHAAVFLLEWGLKKDAIVKGMKGLQPVAMRLEKVQGINGCVIVNDTYNADLVSLEMALEYLNIQSKNQSHTLILSDILQTGIPISELYRKVNELCVSHKVSRIIGIGPEISTATDVFTLEHSLFPDVASFMSDIRNFEFYHEGILVKGARSFGFERISSALESRKHDTYLSVNLQSLIDNFNFFKSKLKPETKLMVMVKAFSYGTGSYEVASVLEHHQVDILTVAYVDEGVELRECGVTIPVMVMNPSLSSLETMDQYDLEAEVFSMNALKKVDAYTRRTNSKMKIHLKVETGMHRLGFELDEIEYLVSVLKENEDIEVASVFSHLVASDKEDFDDFTKKQVQQLNEFSKLLSDQGINGFICHVLNSDGILRFPEMQMDMVRLGIGLYGISSLPEVRSKLKSVVNLRTRISQIKHLKKGDGVGYNLGFQAEKDMVIATLPIGYADGLSRSCGNGKWSCILEGTRVPIIGNVCMDMCMIDVSEVAEVFEKQEVTIIRGSEDVYKMAELRGTIPYEILTSISQRVNRRFYYGD